MRQKKPKRDTDFTDSHGFLKSQSDHLFARMDSDYSVRPVSRS